MRRGVATEPGVKPGSACRLLAAVAAVVMLQAIWLRPAAAAEPTIRVSSASVKPGDVVDVTLSGWPTNTTVSICGNNALRGSVDCDQVGSVGLGVSTAHPEIRQLTVTSPPVPCPCVVRAATAGEELVRTVAIRIAGVATAPLVDPTPRGPALAVRAVVTDPDRSLWDRLQSSLGGRTRRTLVLTVTNEGATALDGLNGTAAVGRGTQGGEPLLMPTIGALGPGQVQTISVPVSLGAPAFGSYVVYGSIYGGQMPVTFSATTQTQPWGLFVVLVLLIVDLNVMRVLRRRRARRTALPPSNEQATGKQTEVEQQSITASAGDGPSIVGADAHADGGTAHSDARQAQ